MVTAKRASRRKPPAVGEVFGGRTPSRMAAEVPRRSDAFDTERKAMVHEPREAFEGSPPTFMPEA
jgi:hypothetical protein